MPQRYNRVMGASVPLLPPHPSPSASRYGMALPGYTLNNTQFAFGERL